MLTKAALESRFRGALLGCALGDAFGRPLEGMTMSDRRLHPLIDARRLAAAPWGYSDDSEMMISVCQSILHRGRVDPKHLLETLAANYDPARGYGKGMKLIFDAIGRGESWEKVAQSAWATGSRGNGAAVRVAGLACLYHGDREELDGMTRLSAAVTHGDPSAIEGAVLMARAIALAVARESPSLDGLGFLHKLRERRPLSTGFEESVVRIEELIAGGAKAEEAVTRLGNGVFANESVPLALFAFLRWGPDFEVVVGSAARCGGDIDSICAMSGALAGAWCGESELPVRWLENLENRVRGRDDIADLASRLYDLHRARTPRGPN